MKIILNLTVIFSLLTFHSYSQVKKQMRKPEISGASLGLYGIAYDNNKSYYSSFGLIYDFKSKNHKFLHYSLSMNSKRLQEYESWGGIEKTTTINIGISYTFRKNWVFIQPEVQLGYVSQDFLTTSGYVFFNGINSRGALQVGASIKQFDIGFLFSYNFGFGISKEHYNTPNQVKNIKISYTNGFGLLLRYNFKSL